MELFVPPTLQSSLHLLSTHLHKSPPPASSHSHSQLTSLRHSLIRILQFDLSLLPADDESHLLTDLHDAAEAAADLIDDIDLAALHRQVQQLAGSERDGDGGGGDGGKGSFRIREEKETSSALVCGGDKVAEIVEKLDSLAARLGDAVGSRDENGGDFGGGVLDDNYLIDGENYDGFKPQQEEVVEFGRLDPHQTASKRNTGLSKLKKLVSAICSMCKCLDGKGDEPTKVATSIQAPVGDFSKENENGGDFGCLDEVVDGRAVKREVYGRDVEREKLVKMLLDPGEKNVSVVSIIGNGGVGKTTLAHYVYSDERLENYFHTREWVCASDSFDMMRISGELEESLYLSGPLDQSQLLELYERNLMAELKGKRFLLVLDDVQSIEWTLRFASMGNDVPGGKILLTARDDRVLDEESKRNMIMLEGIRDKEFWTFFNKCSFGDDDPSKHPDLERIGRAIAKKLRGFPLATKMVGGVLREKLDRKHWMSILRSKLWESSMDCGDVMPCLRLSYQHLLIQLQRCFAYCSFFPKGYEFEIDKLIYKWMAQGLIQPADRLEDTGREFFDRLLSRSFFELPPYSKSYWRSKYYLMHDFLHDLAESICSDYILVYNGGDLRGNQKNACHLSISEYAGFNYEFGWKSLRTLIINTKHVTELEVLKSVRVLDLSHSYMTQLPDSIGLLIHLRYLNLSGNHIHTLPESLCMLYHLQSLIVPHRCHRLPIGIKSLVNLRHLSAREEAISWIAGIGRLTCLQELRVFHLRWMKGHDIGQLKGMNELSGQLCIESLDAVKNKEEVLESNLKDKIYLDKLQLKWMRWNRNCNPDVHDDVLECLRPPSGLKELEIHWFLGRKSPSWFDGQSLQNLRFIHLRGCKNWSRVPSLGKLPLLEVLKLEDMDVVVDVVGETNDIFKSLKELWLRGTSVAFEGMQISSDHKNKIFPILSKLSIENCQKVMGFPPLSSLQTLKELELRKCPDLDTEMPNCLIKLKSLATLKIAELELSSFPGEVFQWLKHLEIDSCEKLTTWLVDEKEDQSSSSLTSLSLSDTLLPTGPILKKYFLSLHELRLNRCSKLRFFTSEQQRWFKELASLRKLTITDCEHLRSLPLELHHLPCLLEFTVAGCPAIQSLPTSLPASLKMLQISNCNPGLAVQWQDERAPDWVKRVPYRYIS